jgi:hypothetical protein
MCDRGHRQFLPGRSCRDGGSMDAQKLKAELDAAFKNRARLYKTMFDEMAAAIGPARAEDVLGAAIEKRGAEAGAALFGHLITPSARQVADAFLAVSPAEGTLFPHTRRDDAAGGVTVSVARCPLLEAWREDGLPDAEIARLCRIAGRFDTGCFGAAGVGFAATTWSPGKDGCCTLFLGPAAAPEKR